MRNRIFYILFLIFCLAYSDPPFIPNIRVSNDPGTGNQNETSIGIFGRNYVCGGWNDNRMGGLYHVGFAFSTDNGLTWSDDTILIEPTYPEDADPVICIDDSGVVYYFFISFNRSPMRGDVFLTKSWDGGITWGPFINVTPNSPNSLDDKPWAMIEGNNVFVTWYEYGTSFQLKFTRSTDRGLTWSPGVAVGSGGNGTMPFRGTDSTIYVGWGLQNVRLNKSTDMGRTWGSQRTIIPVTWSPGSTPWRVNNIPCFGTSQDRTKLYVVFADSRLRSNQLDVFFSRSTDEGETWSTPVKVNDTPSDDTTKQFYPWLSVDPYDRIHIVWHDTRAGGGRLGQYYAYSTDNGTTWSPNQRISDTAVYANTFIGDYTACASDSFNVYALWCDARTAPSNPDVFFSKAPHLIGADPGFEIFLSPTGMVDSGTNVIPEVRVRNFGSATASFPVWFKIYSLLDTTQIYEDSTWLSLGPGGSANVSFDTWTANVPPDTYLLVSFTALEGDPNPGNDTGYGSVIVLPFVGTEEPRLQPLPKVFVLEKNIPNPFTSNTLIRYALPKDGWVNLQVYNSSGILVRTLRNGSEKSGFYQVIWDGCDEKGKKMSNGVYFYRLKTEGFEDIKKTVLLR